MLDRGEETRGPFVEGWGPWQGGELEQGSSQPPHSYSYFGLDNSLLWAAVLGIIFLVSTHWMPGAPTSQLGQPDIVRCPSEVVDTKSPD